MQVSHSVVHGEVLGVSLEDLFVLSDRVGQLALLDEFLRSAQNLLLVETKTKRNMSANSGSGCLLSESHIPGRFAGNLPIPSAILPVTRGMVFRTRAIVRLVT